MSIPWIENYTVVIPQIKKEFKKYKIIKKKKTK
jgi:hypothetical protein